MANASVPHIGMDQTLAFLRDGYGFISRRCDALGSDAFTTRLLLKPVTCLRGEEAAEMFYGGDHFTRTGGAMPPTVLRLLQDKGSVQQLDGADHRHRKALFVDLIMNREAEGAVADLLREEWRAAMARWAERSSIVLLDEAYRVLTRTICRWMGLALDEDATDTMTRELSAMVENTAHFGPSVVVALMRRRHAERFIEDIVRKIRSGESDIPASAPIAQIARFRDADGTLLDEAEAAVEALNILRPTAAIARYVMFCALALEDHPNWASALEGADDARYEAFAEEVRRLYPFFPVIGGKVRAPFEWHGLSFSEGDWALFDLYGTNHDPRRFQNPERFAPQRDISWRDQGFDFVPQGAGEARTNHRCPGEQFTVAIMREATRLMVEEMDYAVPEQDLSVSLATIPAKPPTRLILSGVRRRNREDIHPPLFA